MNSQNEGNDNESKDYVIFIQSLDNKSKELIKSKIKNRDIYFYQDINEAYNTIKSIHFEKTDIIFFKKNEAKEFFKKLDSNCKELSVIPRIIINNKSNEKYESYSEFLNYPLFNKNIFENSLNKIIEKINQEDKLTAFDVPSIQMDYNEKIFTFEYLKDPINLKLPLYFNNLIKKPTEIEKKNFNKFLRKYLKQDNNPYNEIEQFKYLFSQISRIEDLNLRIPFPLLVKYWLRIYSFETKFYSEMNYALLSKKGTQNYDIYIRALYHGFDFIPFFFKENLYRGAMISNKELDTMKQSLKEKKICHCFSLSFFSCSLEEKVGLFFMKKNDLPKNKQYVLYVINKGNEIDKENVSNADLENFSSHKVEKEILFYPFSSFVITNIEEKEDIKKIEKIRENDIEELSIKIKYYRIELSYIGKYKKDVPPELKYINENEYAKALLHTEILKKEELVEKPEMFTFDIKKYMNIIIAYYTIPPNEKKNKIKLIKYDNSNNSCQMYINDELVDFENEHIFDESKEYKIKFEFNDKIKSAGSLFENCKYLTSINLSYLNLENVSIMTNMFQGCTNLKTIEFNNSNTQNIIRMNSMFYDCKNLTSIDLSKINCENVRDIESMFRNCKNLKNVKFFKSNKEINSMNFLFYNCSSLNSLDLSQFDCPNAGELGNIFGGTFNKKCSIIFKENSILDIKRSSLFD